MSTNPPAYGTPPIRWGPGRILALVFGILLLIPGLGLAAGGGVLLWADLGDRTDGFVFSSTDDFSTDGFALVSERIDLATGADWVPGPLVCATQKSWSPGAPAGGAPGTKRSSFDVVPRSLMTLRATPPR